MSTNETLLPLLGSDRDPFPGAVPAGALDQEEEIEISIRLRSRSRDGVPPAELIGSQRIRDREYLDPRNYESTYGASALDLAEVRAFAATNGLQEVGALAGERLLHFRGSVANLSQAFGTTVQTYDSPSGRYRGREGPLRLPANLLPIVQGIFGLDDRPQARSFIFLPPSDVPPLPSQTPNSVGRYYSLPENLSGAGQCIGIVEFGGGFVPSDVSKFFHELDVPDPDRVIKVREIGAKNNPTDITKNVAEVALDVEMAGSIAPGAKIVVYFAPATEKGWVDALTAAIHDPEHRISVLSISWGYAEGRPYWTWAAMEAVNEVLNEAANFGVTVCAASGDDGTCPDSLGRARVQFPASSPFLLSCGGTSFVVAGQQKYEKVWNTRGGTPSQSGASGGGLSDFLKKPIWQPRKVLPAVLPPRAQPSFEGRGLPDVAALAECSYQIFYHGQHVNNVGGTSAASPLWAGLVARLNEGLGKSIGYINPLLYGNVDLQNTFNDITCGDNRLNGAAGYSATPGWDPCTGWGTPNGVNLFRALQS